MAQPINTIEADSQALLPQKDPAVLAENEMFFTQNTEKSLLNTMKRDVVESKLETNFQQGLSEETAQTRLLRFGKNKIASHQYPGFLREFFSEVFTNLSSLLAILGSLVCILISAFSSEEKIQILFAAIVGILLQVYVTAFTVRVKRKNRSMLENTAEKFQKVCLVLRGGEQRFIPSEELVVGDIIFVREGEHIKADILMIESFDMKMDCSNLTGETIGVKVDVSSSDKNIFESRNMVFYSSKCEEGYGKGIVIATGNRTFYGQFSQLYCNIPEKSKLTLEIDAFEKWLCVGSFVFSLAACMVLKFPLEYSTTSAVTFSIILATNTLLAVSNSKFSGHISVWHSINSLKNNNILVTSQYALENVSFMSMLLAEKTSTLSTNNLAVKSLFFNQKLYSAEELRNLSSFDKDSVIANETFQELHKAVSLCGETVLDRKGILNSSQSHGQCPVIVNGDSADIALSRFFTSMTMQETSDFRNSFEFAEQPDGQISKKQYTGGERYVLSIIQQQTESSNYTLFMKGPPEIVLNRCCKIMTEGNQTLSLNPQRKQKLIDVQEGFYKQGHRIVAFAKLNFDKRQYPNGFRFKTTCSNKFNFRFEDLTFLGFISLYDPPKPTAQHSLELLRAENLKIIMVSNDQDLTCQSFAREINFIPKDMPTNIDLSNDPQNNLTYLEAIHQSSAVVAKFPEHLDFDEQDAFVDSCIQKDFCVFARLQKDHRRIIAWRSSKKSIIFGLLGTPGSQFSQSNSIKYSLINEAEILQKPDRNSVFRTRGAIDEKDGDFVGMKGQLSVVEESIQQSIHIRKNMILSLEQTITISICCYLSVLICGLMKLPLSLSVWSVSVLSVITTILVSSSIRKLNPLQQKYCLFGATSIIKSSFLRSFRISAFAIGAGFICFFTAFNQLGFASVPYFYTVFLIFISITQYDCQILIPCQFLQRFYKYSS